MKRTDFRQMNATQWLIMVLCVLQPVLDVMSFWMLKLGGNMNITLALRFGVLAVVILAGTVLAERKWPAVWLLAGGAVFYLLHFWAGWQAGSFHTAADVLPDLTNFIRVLQIPWMAFALAVFLQRSRDGYTALELGLTAAFCFILAVEVLSLLTGTNPYTYPNKQLGLLGWFYLPSAQSAVLTMLFPPVLCRAMRQERLWWTVLVAVAGFGALYLFATRLSYLSIFLIGLGTVLGFRISGGSTRSRQILVLVCVLACGVGFSVSPMKRNQDRVAENAQARAVQYEALAQQGLDEFGADGYDHLTYVYEDRLGGLVDRFGLEAVAECYDGSDRAEDLADVRRIKLNYCRLLRAQSPAASAWFGLAYPEMTWKGTVYDVENDFHGILYLYGYVGLGLMLFMLLYIAVRIVRSLIRDFRRYCTPEAVAVGLMLVCGVLHGCFTGGLLRRPNASFYLSVALAAAWHLTRDSAQALPERVNR